MRWWWCKPDSVSVVESMATYPATVQRIKDKRNRQDNQQSLHCQTSQKILGLRKYCGIGRPTGKNGDKHWQEGRWAKHGRSVKKGRFLGSNDVSFPNCKVVVGIGVSKGLIYIECDPLYQITYSYDTSCNPPWHISHIDHNGNYAHQLRLHSWIPESLFGPPKKSHRPHHP